MRSHSLDSSWLNHARRPLAVLLVWLSSQTQIDYGWAGEPAFVARAQSETLGLHEPRYSSLLKAWCDCLTFKPASTYYGRGLANWTRHHQSRLPVVPPLYEADFGYRPACWRQLPVSTCRRDSHYPMMEIAPPAQGTLPGSLPEQTIPQPYDSSVFPPPAPPANIELGPGSGAVPESVPPPPVFDSPSKQSPQGYNNLFNQPMSTKPTESAAGPSPAVSSKSLNWRRESANLTNQETLANRPRWYSSAK